MRCLIAHEYVVHPSFYQPRKMKTAYNANDIAKMAKILDAEILSLKREISRDFPETI